MPRARPVEVSRSLLSSYERESPRHEAVASKLKPGKDGCSYQRDTPRRKPVASQAEITSLSAGGSDCGIRAAISSTI